MTINQMLKWERRIIKTKGWREYKDENGKKTGKGYFTYPPELLKHLKLEAMDCEHCKNKIAEQATINFNILVNGGQYRPHNPIRR